jgi:hypothetical protein
VGVGFGRGYVETIQEPAGDVVDAYEIGEIHYSVFSEGVHGRAVQIRVNAMLG